MQRQYREMGDKEWIDCDEDWFDYCRWHPLYDTRTIPRKEN